MRALAVSPSDGLVLAVSGGPDSMALAVLAARWRDAHAAAGGEAGPLVAVVVDHRLRDGSEQEAETTRARLEAIGVEAKVRALEWAEPPSETTLQTAARNRRYAVLADECERRGVRALAVAHHLQDNIETVLMRFARSSGLRGLSGMGSYYYTGDLEAPGEALSGLGAAARGGGRGVEPQASRSAPPPRRRSERGAHYDRRPVTDLSRNERQALAVVRPFLRARKEQLQATCAERGVAWVTDPSNEYLGYDRVRVRQAVRRLVDVAAAPLAPGAAVPPVPASPAEGPLRMEHLAGVVDSLRETRGVMDSYIERSIQRCAVWVGPFGMCYVDVGRVLQEDTPIQVAVLLGVFQRLGQPYLSNPSTHSLQQLLLQLRRGPLGAPHSFGFLRVVEEAAPAEVGGAKGGVASPEAEGGGAAAGVDGAAHRMLRVYRAVFEDNTLDSANVPAELRHAGTRARGGPSVWEGEWDGRHRITLAVHGRGLDRARFFARPLRMSDRGDLYHRGEETHRRGMWRKPPLLPYMRGGSNRKQRIRSLLPPYAFDAGLPAVVDHDGRLVALPHFPALAMLQGSRGDPRHPHGPYAIATARCYLSSPPDPPGGYVPGK